MSAISSVGNSTAVSSQPIQALPTKQAPRASTPVSSPAVHPTASDSDHDGDSDGGGIDKTA